MSHFAKVVNGIVEQVIVAEQPFIDSLPDAGSWIKTSYNTFGGVHYAPDNNDGSAYERVPDGGVALRANFAGVGFTYDSTHDVFYAPRPKDRNGISCESWTISAPTWLWTPPTPRPIPTTPPTLYEWDEPTKTWIAL